MHLKGQARTWLLEQLQQVAGFPASNGAQKGGSQDQGSLADSGSGAAQRGKSQDQGEVYGGSKGLSKGPAVAGARTTLPVTGSEANLRCRISALQV